MTTSCETAASLTHSSPSVIRSHTHRHVWHTYMTKTPTDSPIHPQTQMNRQTAPLQHPSTHAHTHNTSGPLMALIGELECVSVWTLGMRNICCLKSQEATSTTWSRLSEFITELYSATIKAFGHVQHTSVMCSQEKGHLPLLIFFVLYENKYAV